LNTILFSTKKFIGLFSTKKFIGTIKINEAIFAYFGSMFESTKIFMIEVEINHQKTRLSRYFNFVLAWV
jgi:hypothetical protein